MCIIYSVTCTVLYVLCQIERQVMISFHQNKPKAGIYFERLLFVEIRVHIFVMLPIFVIADLLLIAVINLCNMYA